MPEPQGCLLSFLRLLFAANKSAPMTPAAPALPNVMLSNRFITPAEQTFFRPLQLALANRPVHILAQVSLRQLLFLPGRSPWQNKINQKSIDFILLDSRTLRPLLAIELNDSTHSRPDRRQRDADLALLFHAARFPFLQIPWAPTYHLPTLSAQLTPHLPA